MSTERDIIIERLEQKLAARDKEIAQIQETLKESIILEMEKRFTDKIKLRESTLEDIRAKFGEKINDIIQMNKSLRDSVMGEKKTGTELIRLFEARIEKMEHRLVELNSAYDGVMKELLDQKSLIQELRPKKPKEEPKAKKEVKPVEEAKPAEKTKPKSEYIIADNYIPREKRKPQAIIEAEERIVNNEANVKDKLKEQLKRPVVKKSEKILEGVEISETLKRGK